MKNAGISGTLMMTAGILLSVTVLACFCVGTVKMEKKAAELSEAVLWAQSAAESFCSASDEEELAELLFGKAENQTVTAKKENGTELSVALSEKEGMAFAKICVKSGEETVYTLECRKALNTEGQK